MALNYGRDFFEQVSIFRPHNVYGPDMGWGHVIPEIVAKLADAPPGPTGVRTLQIQGDGSETRAFCFIEDFVDGLLTVSSKGGNREVYHIGSPEETTIATLCESIARVMEQRIELQQGPYSGLHISALPRYRKVVSPGILASDDP